jgi:hypothetical protein
MLTVVTLVVLVVLIVLVVLVVLWLDTVEIAFTPDMLDWRLAS